MHHINYFRVNLGAVYMGQCISVTDKEFCMTKDILWKKSKKKFFNEKTDVRWGNHSGEQH